MLEIRLPHEVKDRFMRRCRDLGLSASEVVREQIDRFLARTASAEQEPSMKHRSFANTAMNFAARPQALAGAVAVALAAAIAFVATPSSAGPDFRAVFDVLDTNRDGIITQQEFGQRMNEGDVIVRTRTFRMETPTPEQQAHAEEMSQAFMMPMGDLVTEGALEGEVPSAEQLAEFSARAFARLDADGDGAVSFEEYRRVNLAMLRASFAAIDKDRDGRLVAEEFAGAAPIAIERTDAAALSEGQSMVRRLDQDGDQAVSWEEYTREDSDA
jgi:Ca2+-binding EF-hand superfamily protein